MASSDESAGRLSAQARAPHEPTLVVGIGASAGGLDAVRRLVANMPSETPMAVVIVMHLDPSHESHIARLLAASTAMEVRQATDVERLEAGHAYVIAPDRVLKIHDGALHSTGPRAPYGERKPVDTLLSSLAEEYKERAVGVILSGTGNNGSSGIRTIEACGGLCLVQDPTTAEYDGMPRSAIESGVAHYVLSPEDMPRVLTEYAEQPGTRGLPKVQTDPVPSAEAFNGILELLGRTYGVNFRGAYRRGTLQRRTERRMGLHQVSDLQQYVALLQKDPTEVGALYRDVLIGVTEFFRDPPVWEQLASEVVPDLLERHDTDLPVKVWVPGCATGEEAYSLAIVFLEQIERMGRPRKLQIYATDVAEEPLATARRGLYPSTIQQSVSSQRLSRFFRREGDKFQVAPEVRESVTFAVHNLLADPPFSGLDLVSCRNVLIYLEPHAQQRVLDLFHFGLKSDGVLLLGGSETVGQQGDLFEPLSTKARIYKSRGTTANGRRRPVHWPAEPTPSQAPSAMAPRGAQVRRIVEQAVLSRHTSACVVITESFEIQFFFGPIHDYLVQPTGEARMDVLAWARTGLYPGLRRALDLATERKERVTATDLRVDRDGTSHRVECTIEPIALFREEAPVFLIAFRDLARVPAGRVSDTTASEEPLVRQLETELKYMREELQNTIDQLDRSNEGYRASHEEMLSLNEELQSNNEELEASKEELQSLNEEMLTINRQLEEKNAELRSANADINNLLVSAQIPIVFLDRELRVRRFTPTATALMPLVPSDVGRSIEHIKKHFRDGRLIEDAKKVLERLTPIETEIETEGGRSYARSVLPYRTQEDRIDGVCIAFHDVTERKKAAREIDEARLYAEAIIATVRTGLVVLDRDFRVLSVNDAFCERFRVSKQQAEGKRVYELANGEWNIPKLREMLEETLPQHMEVEGFEVEQEFGHLGRRVLLLNARLMQLHVRGDRLVLLSVEDVTERKADERATKSRAEDLVREHRRKDEFLAMLGHELRNPLAALIHGLELLELAPEDPARGKRSREMMKRHTRRISAILDQLLDVARLAGGKIQMARVPVDLRSVVEEAVEAVTPLIESRKHELVVAMPPDTDLTVAGDLTRLVQAVENLLTNAAKYTQSGGKIELSVELEGETTRIRVADTGPGLDLELIPHIFELFTQAPRALDRAAGGLGLGLPLVKRVVEMHGGSVEARNAGGAAHGSEFIISLPTLRERHADPRQDRAASGVESAPSARPLRILVVEDEKDSAAALAEILSSQKHDARVAYDGLGAIEVARSFRPEVVLLDLGLPEMNGYEVAERLRAQDHDDQMRLVALTGYDSDPERLKETGFDAHLLKPLDVQKLFACIGERKVGKETERAESGDD